MNDAQRPPWTLHHQGIVDDQSILSLDCDEATRQVDLQGVFPATAR